METTTTYFEQRGKGNTQRVLELARGRAQALDAADDRAQLAGARDREARGDRSVRHP